MRCALGLSFALAVVAASSGCKNQSTPMSNPFLTPDRVPPPSTRVLTPGTAQPYYSGGALPGAATSVPFGGATMPVPGATMPPATVPPATAYPGGFPAAPVTPPGGWGASSPRAAITANDHLAAGETVRVPGDGQQARFASASASAPPPAFTPNAGASSPLLQAAYDETPAAGPPGLQRLQPREVTPAEYLAPVAATPAASQLGVAATPTRDGFRPQSAASNSPADESSPANGFRSPSSVAAAADPTAQFGVGPNQEWLRGQLEYWPTTGEWSVKYMPEGSVDSIGGRILIENPQVLGHLPPGEFVMVQGQVFGHQIDDASYRPAYRVGRRAAATAVSRSSRRLSF